MPLLQSTQTQTANGAPLYIPADGAGNAVVPGNLVVTGNEVVGGNISSNTVTANGVTVNPNATTSINLGLGGGFPSVTFTAGATSTLIGLQSAAGPILIGNNNIDVGVPHDLFVGETLAAAQSVTAGTTLVVGNAANVGGAISGYNGVSLVTPNFPQGLASIGNASVASLDGAWAGTTIPTLPFGGIPANTSAQCGNIKLGNTRVQWGVANITFTAGAPAISVVVSSAYSTTNTCCWLTGAFGNVGNLPVTLQASPQNGTTFNINAAVGGVGLTGGYSFQWLTIGPSDV